MADETFAVRPKEGMYNGLTYEDFQARHGPLDDMYDPDDDDEYDHEEYGFNYDHDYEGSDYDYGYENDYDNY